MKRVLKYLILLIGAMAVTVCLGAMAWISGTANGARWLMVTASRCTGLSISAKTVEGKLAGTLKLSHLIIRWSDGFLTVEQARLGASPAAIFTGNLHLNGVVLKNITMTDNSPKKPPVLQWPKVSGLAAWFGGAVDRLEIENFIYRRPDEKPVTFRKIAASADWTRGYLTVKKIQAVSDDACLTGDIRIGFFRPLLAVDVVALPSHPVGDIESFHLTGKLLPARAPEQLAGNIRLTGNRKKSDTEPLWELSLDTAVTSLGFPLRKVHLSRRDSSGVLTAEGLLTFRGAEPYLSIAAEAKAIDWMTDVSIPLKLSGSLTLEGTVKKYGGNFSVFNPGKSWRTFSLAGNYSGNDDAVKIQIANGNTMNGSLSGQVDIDWREGLRLYGTLYGRNLNPAVIEKEWTGQINFDLTGRLQVVENNPPHGDLFVQLKQSRLHGQSLTGNLHTSFSGKDFKISDLALQGKGFRISAAGNVSDKIDFTARISDLSNLVPETSGKLSARGWVKYSEGNPAGSVSIEAQGVGIDDLTIASADINARFGDRDMAPLSIKANVKKLNYGLLHADTFNLQAEGTRESHTAEAVLRSGPNEINLGLSGSWRPNEWRGRISRIEGHDKIGSWHLAGPAGLVISSSGLTLDPFVITGGNTESIKASCRIVRTPLSGFILLDWNGINLQRIGAWLNSNSVTGLTRGSVQFNILPQKRLTLAGKAFLYGTFNIQGRSVGIRQGILTADAGEKGTRADLSLSFTEGGMLNATFSSAAPAGLYLPDDGHFNVRLQGLDSALLSPVLPGSVRTNGKITAEADGRLLAGKRITMTGRASAVESVIRVRGSKSDIRIDLKEAALDWVWRDDALTGNLLLKLTEFGNLEGRFRLPVAARFPVTFDEHRPLQASVSGAVNEKGALTALFPGVIQESRGRLDLDLKLNGTWQEPHIAGDMILSQAGGYLPTAGITLKDARINARYADNAIFIDSFNASSGSGHVEGSAVIRLKNGEVTGFEGHLNGDRFQTIYFPELQVQSSPKLTFSGTPQKIAVAGEILLPEVSIIGAPSTRSVQTSPDVVREGKAKPVQGKLPFDLDARVKIILGDSVYFKMGNIDAQLAGNVDLQMQDLDRIAGRGEIHSLKGRFQTYGVNLDIVRGRLAFTGGPVNQPGLDILALRKVGDVKAGVTVTGKLPSPLIKLYSEPAMQDTDILAYIVLGHPLGNSTEQAGLLAMAAGALLSSRQAEGLQSQIKSRLGLSSFDISAGVVDQSGRMGYKPVKVPSAGAGTSATADSTGETMVVIGRYLTPKLYVSYGRSLFTGSNLFSLRYNLSPKWQVESQTGNASGVDIYYRLEFN